MELFNEKWNNSSIVTKVAMFAMALSALMLLICSILFFSLVKYGGSVAKTYGLLWLILFAYTAVVAYGLLRVNRAARIATIIIGLYTAFPWILLAILFIISIIRMPILKTALEAYFKLLKSVVPMIMSFVPGDAKALGGFLLTIFIGPMILNVLTMLLLLFRGGDFKGEPKRKSKLVAYLLWLFLGGCSAHKFYLEKDGAGIAFFLTCQALWFGWVIGLFTLGKQVDAYNARLDDAPVKG